MASDMKSCLNNLKTANIDELINNINTLLKGKEPSNRSAWDSLIKDARQFLNCLDQLEKEFGGKAKVDLLSSGNQVSSFIGGSLVFVGDSHWVLVGLSMIGSLIEKKSQMSQNRYDCFALFQDMRDLTLSIKDLRIRVDLRDRAFVTIFKGCILCAKQLSSGNLFRFLKSSLDKRNLERLRSQICNLNSKIQLESTKLMQVGVQERLGVTSAICPDLSAGIRKRQKHVMDMLQIGKNNAPFRAVIIYGFGGIGKSALARAVISKLDLKAKGYTYTSLNLGPKKKSFTDMQQQILNDLFPEFNGGTRVDLRDPDEGKKRLKGTFEEWNKPVFLFIDEVQDIKDLKELLPEGLELLTKNKRIRFLLTTRNLSQTNMFKKCCNSYLLKPLSDSDAKEFLRNQTDNRLNVTRDVEKILKICCGVPLVLEIVCGYLKDVGYSIEKISQALDLLQKGEQITKCDLSKCMVDDVYGTFEGYAKDAFLDICCFFKGMHRRIVEPVVGSLALKALRDAALITLEVEPESMQENDEIVVVNDLIRARGKAMAGSTRITDIQAFENAVNNKRVKDIKGIELYVSDQSSYVLKHYDLQSLRILVLGRNVNVGMASKMTFPELRYVSLSSQSSGFPIPLEELKTLAVYQGPLVTRDGNRLKLPPSVRRITVTNTSEHSSPLPVAPNSSLEALSLTKLSTNTLPKQLQDFTKLRFLRVSNLKGNELPEAICRLHRLITLILPGCRFKYLPRSFGNLECLRQLDLEDCTELERLPSIFVKLKALRYLDLTGCTSFKSLPSTFGELTDLRGLTMKNCKSLREVPGLRSLRRLKYLNIRYCSSLKDDFGNIRGLKIVR